MSVPKMWVRAQRGLHHFGVELHVLGRTNDNKRQVRIKDITYKEYDSEEDVNSPPIMVDEDAAQQLMDDLWLSGIRPNKTIHGDSDKEDIKNHLEDMRRIVFQGITINLSPPKVDKPKE